MTELLLPFGIICNAVAIYITNRRINTLIKLEKANYDYLCNRLYLMQHDQIDQLYRRDKELEKLEFVVNEMHEEMRKNKIVHSYITERVVL